MVSMKPLRTAPSPTPIHCGMHNALVHAVLSEVEAHLDKMQLPTPLSLFFFFLFARGGLRTGLDSLWHASALFACLVRTRLAAVMSDVGAHVDETSLAFPRTHAGFRGIRNAAVIFLSVAARECAFSRLVGARRLQRSRLPLLYLYILSEVCSVCVSNLLRQLFKRFFVFLYVARQ